DQIYDSLPGTTLHSDASQSGHMWKVCTPAPALRLANRQLKAEFDERFLQNCSLHLSDHHEMAIRQSIDGPPVSARNTTVFTADLLIVYTQRRYCIPHCVDSELRAHRAWLTAAIAKLDRLNETTLRIFIMNSKNAKKAYDLVSRYLYLFSFVKTVNKVEVVIYDGERRKPQEADPQYPLAVWSRKPDRVGAIETINMSVLDELARKAEEAVSENIAKGGAREVEYLDCDVNLDDYWSP
ncbi:hypothetical protein LTR95_013197, partial [Oleoguttula sp. CCFEE 5521]